MAAISGAIAAASLGINETQVISMAAAIGENNGSGGGVAAWRRQHQPSAGEKAARRGISVVKHGGGIRRLSAAKNISG